MLKPDSALVRHSGVRDELLLSVAPLDEASIPKFASWSKMVASMF